MELKQNYTSPRWSMEIPDCSMPMTFDTYSRCSYNCLYCFSFFQKSHTVKGYLEAKPRCVNPEKVIALFENAAVNNTAAANKTDVQFFPYIRDRRIMQWAASRTSSTSTSAGTASPSNSFATSTR